MASGLQPKHTGKMPGLSSFSSTHVGVLSALANCMLPEQGGKRHIVKEKNFFYVQLQLSDSGRLQQAGKVSWKK